MNNVNSFGVTRYYYNDGIEPSFELIWVELDFATANTRWNTEYPEYSYNINGRFVRRYSFGRIS